MLEAKYYRDYGHNYMILQCRQQETERSYQYKILTSGRIGEILSCSLRHINGCTYYYYDISSRTTLDSLYRGKKMTYVQVKDVLCQIRGIYEKLAGYFMEEAGLVLLPEHIYYDITGKKYIGLYYPDYRPEGSAYEALTDFLLEHIDADDRNLAEKMYRMCEMSEENCFSIEDMLQILEEDEGISQETLQESVWEEAHEPTVVRAGGLDITEPSPEANECGKNQQKRNWFYKAFAVFSVLGIAGAAAVYNLYELTEREEIIIYGSTAAMSVCLLLCVMGIFADSRKKTPSGEQFGNEEKEGYYSEFDRGLYAEADENQTADCIVGANMPPLDRVISRNMDLEIAGFTAVSSGVTRDSGRQFRPPGSCRVQSSDNCGNTVFFDGSAVNEYKLYAMDKKNKNHIQLKQFPCTIGKMAGCVDYVLSDDSISRIHARFDMEGEKVLLTDMNSTNGTYKNGLRMQPQETVELEPGDEVRFGNLNYCYR